MVGEPVTGQDAEREEERGDGGDVLPERRPQLTWVPRVLKLRHPDLDGNQRDGDREHGVGEHRQTLELEPGPLTQPDPRRPRVTGLAGVGPGNRGVLVSHARENTVAAPAARRGSGQCAVQRRARPNLCRTRRRADEDAGEWTLPWLPVDEDGFIDERYYPVKTVMYRRPGGRPMPVALEQTVTLPDGTVRKVSEFHPRRPPQTPPKSGGTCGSASTSPAGAHKGHSHGRAGSKAASESPFTSQRPDLRAAAQPPTINRTER